MLPDETVPDGLGELLKACRSCFSARSFPVFCLLTVGIIAQVGPATVTGMLLGAGIQHVVGHDRVHRFFSEHRWSTDQLGLCLARIIVTRLLPAGAAVTVLVDDTLFRRREKTVAQAHFGHDASQPGRAFARGNRWVIAGIVVTLPGMTRPVCLPVLLRLWRGKGTASCVDLARVMVGLLSGRANRRPQTPVTPRDPPRSGRLAEFLVLTRTGVVVESESRNSAGSSGHRRASAASRCPGLGTTPSLWRGWPPLMVAGFT